MSAPTYLESLHLDSLGGDGVRMAPAMALALDTHFAGLQHWQAAFAALCQAHAGEVGHAVLVFRPGLGALCVDWVANTGQPVEGGQAILALAGAAPGGVGHFLAHIDWAPVYARYAEAVHAAGAPWAADQAAVEASPWLLDVRRAGVYQQASTMIPGAQWRDPALVAIWAAALPCNAAVLVYCVYGHEVSRVTALRLRAAGVDARFLLGGLDGWVAAGRPTVAKEAAS